MPESFGDENDSRTASFQRTRANTNGSNNSSRQGSQRPNKRQKRGRRDTNDNVRDFVPQGATFSANTLEVDPDSTSSSGSSDNDDSAAINPHAGSTAPAINWNQGSRRAIRTTLGGRRNSSANYVKGREGNKPDGNESKSDAQFEAVNGKYWRSRSDSVSTGGSEQKDQEEDVEEGEVNEGEAAMDSDDSGDSESLDSKADDSIMLNIGNRPAGKQNGQAPADENDDYDPEFNPGLDESLANGSVPVTQNGTADDSKDGAMRNFTRKYPTAPAVVVDLVGDDKDFQTRFMYWKDKVDDQCPVSCTECLQEGHIAQVCPSRECEHCGAWNQHASHFCPSWRRCQRCRERGHDESQCSSLLKASASEVPCDLCGSSDHVELECDYIWKLPLQDPSSRPVLVSISCSHCTSGHHLMGDCPSLNRKRTSSSWTLHGVDPGMITNTNTVIPNRRSGPAPRGQRGGMRIRGRADQRSPTPDSDDDMLAARRRPPPPSRGRGNIRIGSGIGRGKNLSQNYRDRNDPPFGGDQYRQGSLSPVGRPGRGRGGGRRSRSPPSRGRGRSGPPPPPSHGGGRGRGKRGGGNGGDAYRPLPRSVRNNLGSYRV